MTNVKRFVNLMELAQAGKAWIRTSEDAVTEDGSRVSPYPELAELLARLERMQKALKTLNSRWGVRSGECYTCDLRHGKHSSDCPIPEIKSLLAEALEEKP